MNTMPWERNYASSRSQAFFKIGFRKFYKKTPVLESPFSQDAGLKTYNFINKKLQHRYHDKETTEAVARRYFLNRCS